MTLVIFDWRRNMNKNYIMYLMKNPHHVLWLPEQGLWNIYTNKIFKGPLRSILIYFDTLIRCLQVFTRRIKMLGAKSLFSNIMKKYEQYNIKPKVSFIDLGQHKVPYQAIYIEKNFSNHVDLDVYAYEAHPDYCTEAKEYYINHCKNNRVMFYNLALVGPKHHEKFANLYLTNGTGLADSLYKKNGHDVIQVKASRLSDEIHKNNIELDKEIVIIRMNIEGSEFDVLNDLVEADVICKIDGFLGMWDDTFKIDPLNANKFRKFLKINNIKTFPFNDRDLFLFNRNKICKLLRQWAIRYHISTLIENGRRLKQLV
jgi:FkbM family methyltransferase